MKQGILIIFLSNVYYERNITNSICINFLFARLPISREHKPFWKKWNPKNSSEHVESTFDETSQKNLLNIREKI